jgi:exodeoxyribonuclease-3
VRLATWNVNSLKARMPRVEQWLADVHPDVVCLQETKLSDKAFPALSFSALGYESVHHGQGQWNGVAILSRVGITDVVNNFHPATGEPDPDARIITAMCGGVLVSSVYVPNGRTVDHEHYRYKLRWMAQLRDHVNHLAAPGDAVVVTGDFNIAPTDADVYDPSKFIGSTHVTPQERQSLDHLCDWGLIDLFRARYPQPKLFSYWDYRAGDFHMGRGMRIDLVLGTRRVAERCTFAVVDRNARKGEGPSDHAPVIVDLADLSG